MAGARGHFVTRCDGSNSLGLGSREHLRPVVMGDAGAAALWAVVTRCEWRSALGLGPHGHVVTRCDERNARTKGFPLEVEIAICASRGNVGAAERTASGRAACSNGGREICIHVECDPHARNENGGARHSA